MTTKFKDLKIQKFKRLIFKNLQNFENQKNKIWKTENLDLKI